MTLIDALCIAGGFSGLGGIFISGLFGERARIDELGSALGGAL